MIGPWELACYAFGALTVLLLVGMPIAFAMVLVGVGGIATLIGWQPALALLGQIPVSNTMSYELSVVPMFILMGAFIARSGISGDLYAACNAFVGHRRGGLAIATIMACGAFGAVCGSAIATAATMSRVAYPPMRRYGYHEGLASASVCAGGTLGILIPPSVIMVIYGIMTEHRHRQAVHRRHPAGVARDRASTRSPFSISSGATRPPARAASG